NVCRSKRADREIAQPQVCNTPVPPRENRAPFEPLPQQIVAAPHRDADALTEKPALQIGAASEHATIGRVSAIEPESQRNSVTEQKIDLAALERKARCVSIGEWTKLSFGEQRLQKCFVRGACDNSDLFSLEGLRADVLDCAVTARNEPGRCAVIWIAEIDTCSHVRSGCNRCNDGIAVVAVERTDQCIEPAHLDRAGDLEFLANHPREIHVEPHSCSALPGISQVKT